jgi:hypothetical protein
MPLPDETEHAPYLTNEDGQAYLRCVHHSCRYQVEVNLPKSVQSKFDDFMNAHEEPAADTDENMVAMDVADDVLD